MSELVEQKKQVSADRKAFLQKAVKIFLMVMLAGLPLVVTDGFSNITETKSVFFFASSLTFLGVALYHIVKNNKEREKSGLAKEKIRLMPLDIALLCFGGCVLLSALFSSYQADVWLGIYSRYQGVLTLAVYILLYFVISRYYKYNDSVLIVAVIAFSVVSLLGVLNCFDIDFIGFYARLAQKYKTSFVSTIGNINFYSSYMCLLMPLVISGFCQSTGKTIRIVYTAGLVMGSFGMMVTSSESYALGLGASLVVMPLFFIADLPKLKKFLLSVVIIVASTQLYCVFYRMADKINVPLSKTLTVFTNPVVALGITVLCALSYLLVTKFPGELRFIRKIYTAGVILIVVYIAVCFVISNTIGFGKLDNYFRITSEWGTYRGKIWGYCIDAFKDFSLKEKLFGVGPEALHRITASGNLFEGQSVDQAHNEYLHYLMTSGIFGLVSYLGVIAAVCGAVVRTLKGSTLAVGIFSALVSYWIQAGVNLAQPFTTPLMYIYIAIIGGKVVAEMRKKQQE